MINWIENLFGETVGSVMAIFVVTVCIGSEAWEWIAWCKLRQQAPPSPMRRGIELTSLLAGTASLAIFALILSTIVSLISRKEWALNLWIFAGMGACCLALMASPFCRGKVRVAGIVVGVLLADLWRELRQGVELARAWG
jgi:hypothetical protein